ncbi:MAG: putative membrane protein YdjX (TVP38/TMEM64 family) [Ilumatobacter sp.]
MNPTTRTWVQRGVVVALWVVAFLLWRNYQTSNGLSTTQAGQRFIDSIDAAWWGIFAFFAVYLIRPIVLFPASVLTIMGGVLFGPWVGVLVVIVAANTSAMIAYGIGRILGGTIRSDPAETDADEPGETESVELSFGARWSQRLRDNSFETVFIMRLLFLPYDLVNYLCGALRIQWTSFLLATALGSLPGTISFVLLGASLERIDMGLDGLNPWAIAAGVALFIISISISRIVRKRQA